MAEKRHRVYLDRKNLSLPSAQVHGCSLLQASILYCLYPGTYMDYGKQELHYRLYRCGSQWCNQVLRVQHLPTSTLIFGLR